MKWRIDVGDCIEVSSGLPTGSVDAVVTDPPYGIGFMGHEWDQPTVGGQRSAGYRSSTPRAMARVGSSAAVHAAATTSRQRLFERSRSGRWPWAAEPVAAVPA